MFSLICAWTNGWVNNRDTGDLRRHHAHYGVTVMLGSCFPRGGIQATWTPLMSRNYGKFSYILIPLDIESANQLFIKDTNWCRWCYLETMKRHINHWYFIALVSLSNEPPDLLAKVSVSFFLCARNIHPCCKVLALYIVLEWKSLCYPMTCAL